MLGVDVMVEGDFDKPFRNVTHIAALSEMRFMVVVVPMAGDTGCIHGVAERVVRVTIVADQQTMFAQQFERCIPRMIERGIVPVSRFVAVSAFLAAAPIMRIVLGMTAVAGSRRFGKRVIGMTRKAGCRLMLADQCEVGLCVVERNVHPVGRRVAIVALSSDKFVMWIVGFVAGDTGRRCGTVLAARFMTTSAFQTIVLADEREVSRRMHERCFVKGHNIGVTTFVVGMTVRALPALCVSVPAMESLLG